MVVFYLLASYPLLAIFKLLGFNYNRVDFISHKVDDVDILSKINFLYDDAMASATVAINAKAEGDLVISGSKGYIYVLHLGGKQNSLKCALKM